MKIRVTLEVTVKESELSPWQGDNGEVQSPEAIVAGWADDSEFAMALHEAFIDAGHPDLADLTLQRVDIETRS